MMIRHGDVQITRIASIPKKVKKLDRKELAYGEATGHAHRTDLGELFETRDGELFLKVTKLSNVTHEEHKTIVLDPGCYRVSVKRQYTPTGWENVAD